MSGTLLQFEYLQARLSSESWSSTRDYPESCRLPDSPSAAFRPAATHSPHDSLRQERKPAPSAPPLERPQTVLLPSPSHLRSCAWVCLETRPPNSLTRHFREKT